MTHAWIAPGSHALQFYDSESIVHHAIAEFFTQGMQADDSLILVGRHATFKAVAEYLASGRYGPAIDAGERIQHIDAEAALPQLMDGNTFNAARAERLFMHALSQARPTRADAAIRLYGETVDIACQRGRHDTALQLEAIANVLIGQVPRLSILCGYAVERFKDDANARQFRDVCQKHSHVLPVEGLSDALRTRREQFQQNPETRSPHRPPLIRTLSGVAPSHPVYVIDDHANLRRSLERLLSLSNWPVKTFESAEAFLAALDQLSRGCLVLDVQLQGMSGLDLLRRLTDAGVSWPVIVMSALHDRDIEDEALRLGARAFLRKPFDSKNLFDAIAHALS